MPLSSNNTVKKILGGVFFLLLFLQFNLLPDLGLFWLNLALGWLLVLILVGFPFGPLLTFAFLAGFFLDVYGSVPFGFNLALWPLIVLALYWVAGEILSLERNLFSSCVFLFLGFFLFFLLSWIGARVISGNFSFWSGNIFVSARGWLYLILNTGAALLWFFAFNYFHIKEKINAKRI